MDILKNYSSFVSPDVIEEIHQKAEKLSKRHIVNISSTYQGGGVTEILDSAIIIMNELGMDVGWRILHGSPDFFTITKKFHNGLQGEKINLSNQKKRVYYDTNKRFSIFTHIGHDLVVVHNPQPLPLIDFYKKKQPWIFRCHIDLSAPNQEIWNYLEHFITKYDHFVVSLEKYKRNISTPQSIINPAIDPITHKNKEAQEEDIDKYMQKYDIDRNRPILSQISRFDKWKDPLGVLDVYELVRKKTDCQLVLLGSFASDDPEGQKIFQKVKKRVKNCEYENDIKLIVIDNDFLVNCLQRASTVVIQKSIREGFGLTVSEALFKGTPVVASNVGGIPTQITDGFNGFLHDPKDYSGFSNTIIKLLKDEPLRRKLGDNGSQYIKKHFLITRLISDWLTLFNKLINNQQK